jgi:gamma-glutamyltranspeptidase/glutathione hydrolase
MLALGGTVADAAIAAASVLSVVLPQACTIGGDAFILVHDAASGKTYGLNASGRSPAGTDVAALGQRIPERGPRSCTVPGVVGGWAELHGKFGRLPWERILKRAIELATDGFLPLPNFVESTQALHPLIKQDPGATELFLGEQQPRVGRLFKQPALGRTLAEIARNGSSAFFKGEIAERLAAYVQSQGGWLTASDLAAYSPVWVEPLETTFRGRLVRVMPPNSFGLFMLLQLAALDPIRLDNISSGSPERYAALIEAAQSAFAAGDAYVSDPDTARGPASELLCDAGLASLRSAIRSRSDNLPDNRGGTAVVAIADAEGNAVALVQSVFLPYGAAVADPSTGILLNNRMIGFNTIPGHPNVVAPGKLPAHTLNPTITFENREVRQVLLTPGGPGQTLTLVQVMQAMWDHGHTLHEAVALPRWSMDLSGAVVVEPVFPEETLAALHKRGTAAQRGVPGSPFFGSVEAVERLVDGGLVAVADDRREAYALAL